MTRVVFNSGHDVDITLPIDEFAALLTEAMRRGSLLELTAPDGRRLLINPSQIALAEGGMGDDTVRRHLAPATAAG